MKLRGNHKEEIRGERGRKILPLCQSGRSGESWNVQKKGRKKGPREGHLGSRARGNQADYGKGEREGCNYTCMSKIASQSDEQTTSRRKKPQVGGGNEELRPQVRAEG